MKISLGSWAFSFGPYAEDPVPFERIARRLSETGYDGIEVCGFPPQVTLERYATGTARRDLRNLLADLDLGVSGYVPDLTSVNPLAEGHRESYLDLFRRNLELCVEIGGRMVRLDTVAAPGSLDEQEYRRAFPRLAEVWREAAGIAEDAGVSVCWEFEPGFIFNKPSEVAELHRLVNHSNFRLLFDTCHAWMCGVVGARQQGRPETLDGLEEFLDLLKGRIGHLHLIDSDGTLYADETSRHVPFGRGLIDFAALTPKLLQIPNIEWWSIDLCFWAGAWDLVEPSRRFVADLLGEKAITR